MVKAKTERKKRERGVRGRGTVFERKTKTQGTKYVTSISYVDWNGVRHRPQLTFTTREAALAATKLLENERSSKGKIAGSVMTVTELSRQWLNQMQVEPGTVKHRTNSMQKYIVPYLGRKRVIELDQLMVNQWASLLRDSGCKPEAQRSAWTTLSGMLTFAMSLQIIQGHPMHGLRAPKKQRKPIVPFTDAELGKIFAKLKGHRNLPLIQVTYSLGLRQGEVLGLKWSDLDVAGKQLTIQRQVLDEWGELVIKEKTKTAAGRRKLALTKDHLAFFAARRKQAEAEDLGDCEWIFPTIRGLPQRRGNLLFKFWRPLLKELGIRHRGLHHCRHTAATQAILSGHSVLAVAGSLGHSKADTTLRLYAHVIDEVHGQAFGGLAGQATAKKGRQAAERQLDTDAKKEDSRPSPRKKPR
jgi:integrase